MTARNAAATWCRCFKCDGIIRETGSKCDKEHLITCRQWYDGYRTALLALATAEKAAPSGAKFIQLHCAGSGTPFWINTDHLESFSSDSGDGSWISYDMAGEAEARVKETPEEIMAKIEGK